MKIRGGGQQFNLVKYDAINQTKEYVEVEALPKERNLWHIDVTKICGKIFAIITAGTYRHMNTKNYLAIYQNGKFRVIEDISLSHKNIEDNYRSSLVEINSQIHMYTSIKTKYGYWWIYHKNITDVIKGALTDE